MNAQSSGPFAQFGQQLSAYMPTLAAGLVVLLIGVVGGWLAKRALVRILFLLRLDRLAGGSSAWGSALGKGDVRDAVYNSLGTIAGIIVVLIFLDNALQIWGLEVLSRMMEQVLVYLPTLVLSGIIVGLGLALGSAVARRVEQTLDREGAPRAALMGGLAKAAILAVVGALALWELNFGREIVLAAFLIGFGAIGVAFALAVGLGTASAIRAGWEIMLQRNKDD